MSKSTITLPSDPDRRKKLLRAITSLARLPASKRKELLEAAAKRNTSPVDPEAIHPAP